ncbi:OmpP1/FadL family transporter [Nitratidesulfovibrio sp. SRB-5]|uniref:OmpP1/FadL family transporter n=1 Tax=Nitratidesulfovibrio sp. SRB-5 TaxID=2872636 RepID=UPI0010284E19|nr:OmpP1/FadL family transporter [Nitratidesulfovibrio sp. SRB-5]MBZ2171454.1 OmpP1/FadL family transporter [Nitratidesulfovibrio sp. SRB-5]RXF78366.1 transporter [Desulfovibrio sp. DS-1]
MKRLKSLAVSCLLVCTALAGTAQAEGFALYEWGARGNALGGTMVARKPDASAVAYNPALMTQLEGTQVMAGVSAIIPSAKVDVKYNGQTYTGEGADNVWTPPHGYLTTQLKDNLWLGMGIYTRFGLGTEYDDSNWAGRYNIYNAEIQTISYNPNIAFKLTDKLSAAVGVEFMTLKLLMDKKSDPAAANPVVGNNPGDTSRDIDSNLEADSYGWGLTAGLHYQFNDQWAAGVSYKSQIEQEAEGENNFTLSAGAQSIPAAVLGYQDCDVRGSVILPDMLAFGVSYTPIPELSIEVGALLTRWSLYDNLAIYHEPPFANGAGKLVNQEKDWKDAWRYSIGVEYAATPWMDLRAGFTYDESPAPGNRIDYLIPTDDRQLYSTGVGFHWDSYTVDLSYTYIVASDAHYDVRRADGVYEGNSYDGRTHVLGLSLGYKF